MAVLNASDYSAAMTAKYIPHFNDSGCEPLQGRLNSHQRILLVENELDLPRPLAKTLTIRATLVTPILKEIPGYSHGGIND
jgi:hypothetical protein